MQPREESGDFRWRHALHYAGLSLEHINVTLHRLCSGGHLEPNEAAADDDRSRSPDEVPLKGHRVVEIAEIEHIRKVGARHLQTPHRCARRHDELVELDQLIAAQQRNAAWKVNLRDFSLGTEHDV